MKAFLVAFVALLALAGCTTRVGGAPATRTPSTAAPAGPVDLAIPIEFRPVLTTGAPATTLPTDEGEQLALGEPIMTVDDLDNIEAKVNEQGVDWVLVFTLTDEDARTFGDWTGDHVNERLAMIADGEVLMAPTIQSAITGGEVQINGNYDKAAAEDLVARLTGR